MNYFLLFGTLSLALFARAESPASNLWAELKDKRERLPSFHQEFELSQTYKTGGNNQSSKRQVILDMAKGQWREKSSSGSGDYIRIFDGKDLFQMEEAGNEYLRPKPHSKEDESLPSVYSFGDLDLSKLVEGERQPCGISGNNHLCVVLDGRVKKSIRLIPPNSSVRVLDGTARFVFDLETGLLIGSRTVEAIDNGRTTYQLDVTRALKRLAYGSPPDLSLFRLPSGDIHEVKELSRWNAAKIKKELAGKAAPELTVTDLRGKPISLSALKGRTVLLDFWTTWCPPCRADAPSLEKLHQKYGENELTIVGISVSEEREIVEKFLKEHPHGFSVVLTTENEMPRPYQVGLFPTYIVIDRDGTVSAAAEGDKGFGDLKKLLKKAGMETE
jgi:thiol-disulfide isomerase/thioredoxin